MILRDVVADSSAGQIHGGRPLPLEEGTLLPDASGFVRRFQVSNSILYIEMWSAWLRGVKNTEIEIFHGDTMANGWDLLLGMNPAKKAHCNAVVAIPPFSCCWDPNDTLGEDVRFQNYGLTRSRRRTSRSCCTARCMKAKDSNCRIPAPLPDMLLRFASVLPNTPACRPPIGSYGASGL